MANFKARLEWSSNFRPKWKERFSEAQEFLDESVLRDCEPFVPFKTGTLMKSGDLGTLPGSGLVSWIAPYAKYQYYMARKHKSQTKPLSGPFWFETAKKIHKRAWIAGVRERVGGKK